MTLDELLKDKQEALTALAKAHHVRRLELYGSAATGRLQPQSDLDFLVEFEPLEPVLYAEAYFDLKDGLEALFRRPVDLAELEPIRNPYFLRAIEEERVLLYAA